MDHQLSSAGMNTENAIVDAVWQLQYQRLGFEFEVQPVIHVTESTGAVQEAFQVFAKRISDNLSLYVAEYSVPPGRTREWRYYAREIKAVLIERKILDASFNQ